MSDNRRNRVRQFVIGIVDMFRTAPRLDGNG
jgi:hypothetical protein